MGDIKVNQMDFLQGTGSSSLAHALDLIYRELFLKKWNMVSPNPMGFSDLETLYSVNDERVLFHRNHKKFGENIIEYDLTYRRNCFCFFEYFRLEAIFDWYAKQDLDTSSPPIPIFYALPSDRHYFISEDEFDD